MIPNILYKFALQLCCFCPCHLVLPHGCL